MTEVCSRVAYGVSEGVRPDLAPLHILMAALVGVSKCGRSSASARLTESIKYGKGNTSAQGLGLASHRLPFFSTAKGSKQVNQLKNKMVVISVCDISKRKTFLTT